MDGWGRETETEPNEDSGGKLPNWVGKPIGAMANKKKICGN